MKAEDAKIAKVFFLTNPFFPVFAFSARIISSKEYLRSSASSAVHLSPHLPSALFAFFCGYILIRSHPWNPWFLCVLSLLDLRSIAKHGLWFP